MMQQATALHVSGQLQTLSQLAAACIQAGRPQRAVELLVKALKIDPGNAANYSNLGAALEQLRQWDAALRSYDQAIATNPDLAQAHCNRANVRRELRQWRDALAGYDRAIALQPGYANAYNNRGKVLMELGEFEQALTSYDAAIALKPSFADYYYNRGILHGKMARPDLAVASYDACIALNPGHVHAYMNRGNELQAQRRWQDALASFNQAISLKPDLAGAYYNRGMLLLLLGDYENGWADSEWREGRRGNLERGRDFQQPLWLGQEIIDGKRILIYCERGLGDSLQFCRYVKLVAATGAKVLLEVPAPLVNLFSSLEGVWKLIPEGSSVPEFDYQCPLMSLPHAFRTRLATIPAEIPYLRSDTARALAWQERLGPREKLRVGLVWEGGFRPKNPQLWDTNKRRNTSLQLLAALKPVDAEFFSLQKGEPAESELAQLLERGWDGPPIRNYAPLLSDFAETAALIENLDLVVSVDTSTAHLAAAMGKPVWILNRFDGCWRWLIDRVDSPWYPTVRLYRQQAPGDWDGVIQAVRKDLERLTQARAVIHGA